MRAPQPEPPIPGSFATPSLLAWIVNGKYVMSLPLYRIETDLVYGQINVYGVTTKSERHKRSYWTRTADGNGIGGRKAPVPYGS